MQEMKETWVQSLGWEDPLKKEMSTCSSIPAWEICSVRQRSLADYSPWGCKEWAHDWATEHTHIHLRFIIVGNVRCTFRNSYLWPYYKDWTGSSWGGGGGVFFFKGKLPWILGGNNSIKVILCNPKYKYWQLIKHNLMCPIKPFFFFFLVPLAFLAVAFS